MTLSKTHGPYVHDRAFLRSVIASIILLAVAVIATYFAIIYANKSASQPVTDLILSNIPVFDVDGLFVYGPIVFWAAVGLYVIYKKPQAIPFTLKCIAVFTLIRSAFLTLTHIGVFLEHVVIPVTGGFWNVFTTGDDLFFSSHTGLPFLAALVFWNDKPVRYFCLASSAFFGAVVLMAHLHYSIDVFSAFFITYAIFHVCQWLFPKDLILFHHGRPS